MYLQLMSSISLLDIYFWKQGQVVWHLIFKNWEKTMQNTHLLFICNNNPMVWTITRFSHVGSFNPHQIINKIFPFFQLNLLWIISVIALYNKVRQHATPVLKLFSFLWGWSGSRGMFMCLFIDANILVLI